MLRLFYASFNFYEKKRLESVAMVTKSTRKIATKENY